MAVRGSMCKCLLILLFSGLLFYTLGSGDVLSYGNCRDCLRFPSNGTTISHVERILIDATNNRLIVGSTNSLFRLKLTNLKLASANDFVALEPSQKAKTGCSNQGLPKYSCQNNIKILLFDRVGRIFACGTYATYKRCWRFQRTSALKPIPPDGIKGDGISPSSYLQNVTGTFASEHLFTGVNLLPGTGRSVIYRTTADESSNVLLTSDYDSENVLQDANFVSSFLYTDNFVYFFLRETAVERGKAVIYSRVARVCQYDEGGKFALEDKFTSFVKARIRCSVPGNIGFDYNEIQAAIKSTDPKTNEDYIYGIFTTPDLGVPGAAVCKYSMKSLAKLFNESQYLEETSTKDYNGDSVWKAVSPINLTPVPGRPKCDRDLDTNNYSVNSIKFAAFHSLLADPLQSSPQAPLFTKVQTRFTELVVDYVKGAHGAVVPVMFVSTDNGTVFKVFNNISGENSAVIVEQIQVFQKPDPIYTMKLFMGAVYIGSNSSVIKLPVEHCNKYHSCRTCVSSLDPYCGWSNNKCTTYEEKQGSGWAQDIVHGNFSKVCPEEPPTCSVLLTRQVVGGSTLLTCQGDLGIPLPKVTKWTKDSKILTGHSDYQIKPGKTYDQGQLQIYNFGINHLGFYKCFVANKLGSSSCAINITGTLPVITSALVKVNETSLFVCNATGLPTPRVTIYKVIGDITYLINSHQMPIGADSGQRSYYCVAQNAFGSSFGKTVNIQDKLVKAELRLTEEEWGSELSDDKSKKFKTLADQIKTAVGKIYSKNPAFVGFKDMSFRKGSIICSMTLTFAADPSSTNAKLLEDLQDEVSSGKVGQFSVDKSHVLNLEPQVEIATNRPVFSTVQVTNGTNPTTPQIKEPTPAPDKQGAIDNGLFAVAVIVAILLSLILGLVLGVRFHSLVLSHCKRSTGDPESCDGPEHKTVEGVKYTKSPPRDEQFTRNKNETQSKRNLLKKKQNKTDEAEDSDSDTSTAGKIGEDENDTRSSSPTKSISPSVSISRYENKKPPLKNGKIAEVC